MALMVSVSGVRGIVGTSFTPEVIVKYVQAFCAEVPGTNIVLGRDSRVSGPWVSQLVESVLMSCGKQVLNIGIVATPTVQLAVKVLNADGGGIVVTSSHNPVEWNGLKFVGPDSLFLSPERCTRMYSLSVRPPLAHALSSCGSRHDSTWSDRHIQLLLSLPSLQRFLANVKRRSPLIALDTVCGAGGHIMRTLLDAMGCRVTAHLHPQHSGRFPRPPEPVPDNLKELGDVVRSTKSDMGIAVDPDVDRCVILDEHGQPIGEEYTLGIGVAYVLGTLQRRGVVVKNLSSSRVTDDLCRLHGNCPVVATPVGEIHVAQAMQMKQAVVGGEGNGGLLLPELHLGRDAPAAAAVILCWLATEHEGKTVSEALKTLPRYAICKLKGDLPNNFDKCMDIIIEKYKKNNAKIDLQDGIHIDTPEGWVHLRKSNTEPIFRVIGEFGSTYDESLKRCTEILNEVTELSKQIA